MTSKTQMTKAQLIEALTNAENRIVELEKSVEQMEAEKVHIGAKLLDDEQSNMVSILKARIEELESKQ
jgi:predicted nuclease with TOPRIM domain